MSLFSGMRLTPGKKPAQSISAKVQQEGDKKTGDQGGSPDQLGPRQIHSTQVTQLSQKGLESKVVMDQLSQKGLEGNVSDTNEMRVSRHGATLLESDASKGATALKKCVLINASSGTSILKDVAESDASSGAASLEEGAPSGTSVGSKTIKECAESAASPYVKLGAQTVATAVTTDSKEVDVKSVATEGALSSAPKEDRSSLFSFITDSESDATKLGSETSFENIDMEAASEMYTCDGSLDEIVSSNFSKGSCDADFELDPFSVDKPFAQRQVSDSKLSFDLEGLEFTPVSTSKDQNDSGGLVTLDLLEDDIDLSLEDEGQVYAPVDFDQEDVTVEESTYLDRDMERDRSVAETRHDEAETSSEAHQYDIELSFADQLELTLQMHKAKLRYFSEALEEWTSQISTATSDCIHSSYNLLHKQQMLKQIHVKQSEAVAQEDYEQAELLNEQCGILEEELQKTPLQIIPSNHPVILDVIGAISKLHEEDKSCRKEQYSDLDEMKKKQEVTVEEVEGQYSKIEISEKCVLDEEESSLHRDKGHLDLDIEHLSRKEKQLEKRIEENTCDLRIEKEQLCQRRTTLQDEIAELEKKLSSLKNQESQLSKDISHQEDLILKAKEEFKDEVIAIEVQRSQVNEKSSEVEIKEGRVKEMEKRISAKLASSKADVTREQTILDHITEAIKRTEEDESESSIYMIQEPAGLIFQSKEGYQILNSLQEKLKSMGDQVQSVTSEVLQAQTKIVGLRQKVSDMEGHIAALTDAKQLAVSGRNFAEAKRLANEIKELTAEGQRSQMELEKMIETSKKNNEQLEKLQEERNQVKAELAREELKYDSDVKEWLVEHIENLQGTSEDDKLSSLSRTIHQADIQSCAMLVQYLCVKHGDALPDCVKEHVTDVTLAKHDGKSVDTDIAKITEEEKLDSGTVMMSEVQSKVQALESRLQAAVCEEDYDAAQLLQEQIEELQEA